jgi:hypothetical protein
MIDRNSMVPSSRTLVENQYEFREVQSMRKKMNNTKRGPRKGVALGGNEQHQEEYQH